MSNFNQVFAEDQPLPYSFMQETEADKEAAASSNAVSDADWERFIGHAMLPEEVEVRPETDGNLDLAV